MADLQDALNQIKNQFDSLQAAMKTAEERLVITKAAHDDWEKKLAKLKQEHAGKVSELEAKKVAADRAAEENARRIKLNNDQVAEITRIRADLDKREKALVAREQQLTTAKTELGQRQYSVDKREGDVAAKEREINVRYAKMKEAMT